MVRNDHDLEPVAEREVRHVRTGSEGGTDAQRRGKHRDQGHRHCERAAWGRLPRASFQVQVRLGHRGLWVSWRSWRRLVGYRQLAIRDPEKAGPEMDPGSSRKAA